MENVVVQVLNKEHGKEVIQAFKDLGVDTYGFTGSLVGYHYGLINWVFTGHSTPKNSKVITLEELKAMKGEEKRTYPCMMEVWNSHEEYSCELEVISEVEYNGVKGFLVYNEAYGDFYSYKNARPIQPDPLKEVIEKLKNETITLTPNEAQLIIDALDKNRS